MPGIGCVETYKQTLLTKKPFDLSKKDKKVKSKCCKKYKKKGVNCSKCPRLGFN
jgi:hypothetical protein